MVSTPEHPEDVQDFAVDQIRRRLLAPMAEQRTAARAERRFLAALAAASLLLHGLIFFALLRFERAPDVVQAANEIPVEVVVEPPATPQSAAPQQPEATEKPSGPETKASAKSETAQKPEPVAKADAQPKPTVEPEPAEPKAAAPQKSGAEEKT